MQRTVASCKVLVTPGEAGQLVSPFMQNLWKKKTSYAWVNKKTHTNTVNSRITNRGCFSVTCGFFIPHKTILSNVTSWDGRKILNLTTNSSSVGPPCKLKMFYIKLFCSYKKLHVPVFHWFACLFGASQMWPQVVNGDGFGDASGVNWWTQTCSRVIALNRC